MKKMIYDDSRLSSVNKHLSVFLTYILPTLGTLLFLQIYSTLHINTFKQTNHRILPKKWAVRITFFKKILYSKTSKIRTSIFKILNISKLIWDSLNFREYMTHLWSILITVYNKICFGCIKETSPWAKISPRCKELNKSRAMKTDQCKL